MVRSCRARWYAARCTLAGMAAVALLAATGTAAAGAPPRTDDHARSHRPAPVPGPLTVPKSRPPAPLPAIKATLPVPVTRHRALAAAGTTDKVALRALVVATDAADFGLPTWKDTLDRVGAPYDVILTATEALTADRLVRPDGTGRYDAILLTNNGLFYQITPGNYGSALTAAEWNLLWQYERDYGVRQVALYAGYGTFPEDYCLRAVSEGGVGATPLPVSLTGTGAGVFDYLKSDAQIPVTQSYVYRTRIATGCNAQAVATSGADVLGVLAPSGDGRERLALTFTSNQYLLHVSLLTYGLLRWATKGLFLGEQRHYLNVDVDDWFLDTDHLHADGRLETNPGFRLSGTQAVDAYQQKQAFRAQFPLAGDFTLDIAYNGEGVDLTAPASCAPPPPGPAYDQLTAYTKGCLTDKFRWINHTVTHPELNFTPYATNYNEINNNLTIGQQVGLAPAAGTLKTPEYSGLGVWNPNPNDDTSPPVDHGLGASNPALLQAAKDLGVTYLHGNMSFVSHRPACFNCGIAHPLEPSITIVPDWPTNIAYHVLAPDEETYFFNSFYGPQGRFPYFDHNLTYAEVIDWESGIALNHVASGSIYTHTLHQGNLFDYGGGQSLAFDWLSVTMAKYSAYYTVPVLNPGWPKLADTAKFRTGHFAALAAGVDAVYDRAAGTVTVVSPVAGEVSATGAQTAGYETYGTDSIARLTLAAGTPVTFTPVLTHSLVPRP